jgi:hypothetical protein
MHNYLAIQETPLRVGYLCYLNRVGHRGYNPTQHQGIHYLSLLDHHRLPPLYPDHPQQLLRLSCLQKAVLHKDNLVVRSDLAICELIVVCTANTILSIEYFTEQVTHSASDKA